MDANPHYAMIKDQRGNTKTVSTQDLAPYLRRETQNTRGEQMQDFDELASEAANSKPRVLVPKLCLPNEILRSSESGNQDANMDESINSNENEDIIEPSDMEVSSNSREIITRSGRISRIPEKYEDYWLSLQPKFSEKW